MAEFTQGNFITRFAAADLSAQTKQWSIVKLDANNRLIPAAGPTDALFGVLEQVTASGDLGSVGVLTAAGSLKVRVGSVAIAKDAEITSDANGLGVTIGATSGTVVIGRSMEAGAPGQVIEFLPLYRKLP